MSPRQAGEAQPQGGEKASRSISRVLSRTIIHLRPASPPAC